MKLTNEVLMKSYGVLQVLGGNKDIPTRLSFSISKVMTKLESEMKNLEKANKKLVDQFAERGEDGEYVFVDEAKGQIRLKDGKAYQAEYAELMAEETDELGITQIKLEKFDGLTIAPAIFATLDWLVIE